MEVNDGALYASAGPVSTLPGSSIRVNPGLFCDSCAEENKEVAATVRIQGETDSWGCEYSYHCEKCSDRIFSSLLKKEKGECEWCKKTAYLSPVRDIDEGMFGPVYEVCSDCKRRENKKAEEDLRLLEEEEQIREQELAEYEAAMEADAEYYRNLEQTSR